MITVRTDLGGGPKHILDLIKNLKAADDHYYLASPNDLPFGPLLINQFQDHLEIPSRSFNILSFLKLVRFIKKNKITIVHSHGRGAGVYGRLLYFFGVKVVHSFHGIHHEKTLSGQVKYIFDIMSSPFVDHYIYCSEDEKIVGESKRLRFTKNYTVINNGIFINNFKNNVLKEHDFFTMGVMARNDYQKGLDLLFKNLQFLVKQKIQFKFYIAGCEKNEIDLPVKLQGVVEVLGSFSNPIEFLSKLDLYVSHSRGEGLPLSVLEAMASGVPCLLSNVPGHSYFIKNHVAVGFDLENPENFINKYLEFANKNKQSQAIVPLALEFVKQNHAVETMAQKTFDVYRSLNN